jgi:ribosomal protein S12 methylthiotransferase accessory factor YcaO
LGRAIVNGDVDKAIDLQKYKIKDDALVEGNLSEEIEQALRANYAWLKDQKRIELRTYNPREIECSLMANNRVVKLTRSAGEEVLQIESSDLSIEVPVFVSKINGVWKIVR